MAGKRVQRAPVDEAVRQPQSETPPEPDRESKAGAKHLRDLERENERLRRVVADQALALETLREISRGTY